MATTPQAPHHGAKYIPLDYLKNGSALHYEERAQIPVLMLWLLGHGLDQVEAEVGAYFLTVHQRRGYTATVGVYFSPTPRLCNIMGWSGERAEPTKETVMSRIFRVGLLANNYFDFNNTVCLLINNTVQYDVDFDQELRHGPRV
jgi:hypothetical protein